jgi:flavin-dependent dehydrogenase
MSFTLEDGSRVGVIGGGPAGSMFAYFLLTFAERLDLKLDVDIYEPRNFSVPGPGGCNMCGGIVSESLIQALGVEGIELPPNVVQRGIDSYVLHTDRETVKLDTPLSEMRIAAVHRGGGPRDVETVRYGGLDGYLQGIAQDLGARLVSARVSDVSWDGERPQVHVRDRTETYDLLVGATGVNSGGWDLFEKLGFTSQRPTTTKAYITELKLGEATIDERFGTSMHMFLLNIPRLDCAAIIPKGDYATVCLLGDDIDRELIQSFFDADAVRDCFPADFNPEQGACHCQPKINIREPERPFLDRVVLVGDCGVTRLYKDGIGAAYRTAKAAARTSVFSGVGAAEYEKHYWPTYRSIAGDNRYGLFIFRFVHWIKAIRPLLKGSLLMASDEQRSPARAKRMSVVFWDMFTGSAPYRDIFFRTLSPRFGATLAWKSARALVGGGKTNGG